MYEDLKQYSMEELRSRLLYWENALDELRRQEPSTKRKTRFEHMVWVDVCQSYIEEIQNLRDAIIEKKVRANDQTRDTAKLEEQ